MGSDVERRQSLEAETSETDAGAPQIRRWLNRTAGTSRGVVLMSGCSVTVKVLFILKRITDPSCWTDISAGGGIQSG